MKNNAAIFIVSCVLIAAAILAPRVSAQSGSPNRVPGDISQDLREFVATPAVSGYERELAAKIQERLKSYSPQIDNLGDVIVTIGSGSPHRLLVAPMDEPGFVVSGITPDGYLRVQRLPQRGSMSLFDDLYSAQPVRIRTAQGKWIDGVAAGLSIHLQPGRSNPPDISDLENMYVDIGAASPEEVHRAGVDLLSPLAIDRDIADINGNAGAASIGDRFGDVALVELLRRLDPAKVKGTLTVGFIVQQWTGARGLERILTTVKADEMLYVGRMLPGGIVPGMQTIRRAPRRELGSGVLIGLTQVGETIVGFPAEIKQVAEISKIPIVADFSAPLIPRSYLPAPDLPGRWAHVGIATAWPSTPAEMIDSRDLSALADLLEAYAQGSVAQRTGSFSVADGRIAPERPSANPKLEDILARLVETYGASRHELAVREEVQHELPPWAKPETDDAGNLILHLGSPSAKSPSILVVAHQDEIGYEVKSISADGHLELESLGGGEMYFYAGHPALVHSAGGATHDAVFELPNGWDDPGFKWPDDPEKALRADVGAHSDAEVVKLGIKPGDWVTIPKKYRLLYGTRAIGRSFDDRVGCAALIGAVWALGPNLKDRDVTFVWSTGEELGLLGAGALAKRLAAEGRVPDYVFAVDTFVSSDSPIESKRFADADLGKGFVIRAVDNSNIVPHDLVERVIALAKQNKIPVQYGVTGGGNDGSAFTRYGSVDIALGWPLRYSHSPGEVIDTRDLEALSHIVAALAKSW
ncbi:MAG: M20/M25/M40 family metallo-hydrolase [Candidatus Acidiferrales bacterium]